MRSTHHIHPRTRGTPARTRWGARSRLGSGDAVPSVTASYLTTDASLLVAWPGAESPKPPKPKKKGSATRRGRLTHLRSRFVNGLVGPLTHSSMRVGATIHIMCFSMI